MRGHDGGRRTPDVAASVGAQGGTPRPRSHRGSIIGTLVSAIPTHSPDRPSPHEAPRASAFARLFEAVHEGVYIGRIVTRAIGTEPHTTLAANAHLRGMFGVAADTPEADVQPFAAERFADPPARATFIDRLSRDGAVTDYLLRMRRLDGSSMWVEVTARAEPAPAGVLHIEALVRDVSERRRLDDQARDLYHQLLQAEKMAALGQTISGVAHELNNPLATILNWAERLIERPLDDACRRGVETILAESERAARIVRNLLTFARKRQTTRSTVDVNAIVRETLSLRAYEEQQQAIAVVTELAPVLPPVFVDGHQVQQVLLNLMINAEQAMLGAHGRGVLIVRTRHDPADDVVLIDIDDDGPGVPVDVRAKIFDPFFTTKDVGQGTGLGLTVAYAIVQEHGGRITVDSPPRRACDGGTGPGAAFTVTLPVGGLPKAVPASTPPLVSMDAVRGASVLLVEDERALASAVADALGEAGLVVDHAGDGEEALACLRQRAYDVVICDLKMPRVDGMMLYRAMTAATPALARRVIFVTGDVAGTDAERFLAESGCRWLAKPFRLGDLLRAVRDTLG